jgi:hypothetical protein
VRHGKCWFVPRTYASLLSRPGPLAAAGWAGKAITNDAAQPSVDSKPDDNNDNGDGFGGGGGGKITAWVRTPKPSTMYGTARIVMTACNVLYKMA